MNKKIISIIIGIIIAAGIIGGVWWHENRLSGTEESSIPYYFIAIHNEPAHDIPNSRQIIEENYLVLEQMIERANQYNIKLTLMFTAQWADYITESPERMAELEEWKEQGHEIAAHHHSIYHGNWDGYSDYSEEEAIAQRIKQGKKPETYLGTLEDFIDKLKKINPDIKSGCVNDEHDKRAMPDEIIYDTCSGFANYGEPGTREGDGISPEKGKNDFITVGVYNGIERKWLAHYQITTDDRQKSAQKVFNSMDSGVYGSVTHSIQSQAYPYYDFLEFLHSKDPTGEKSRTVAEIIEQELLPEEIISEDLINSKTPPSPSAVNERGKCGDRVCDDVENERGICPDDCGTTIETESCGPDNNGYCIDFREECKSGYEGIGPDTCSWGRSAECCAPVDTIPVSSELSYSFGIHPSSFNGYSYTKDLGIDFNREGVYFIWDWSDINRDGSFKFKKATAPQRSDQPNSGDFINYDDEQEKLSSVANIKLMRNVCPFGKGSLLRGDFRDSSEEKIYQEYVEKLVERYDGDSDLGCTQNAPDCYKPGDNEYPSQSLVDVLQINPIQYWQVCNQVTDTCFEKDCKDNNKYAEKYAKTLELTYKAIKKSCPECQVLIAGDSSKDMYPSVYQALNGKYVDIIDKHFFGKENDYVKIQEEMTYLKDSLKDNGFDLNKLRFWITETGTYSGDPVDDRNNFPEGLPYQSETQQAQGLIKIYAIAFGEGTEKVLWAWGLNEGFGCECCIFDYTGLIYDGNREKQMCNANDPYDLGEGVKKLAYFSYKLMTDKIKGFTSVETVQESNGIYIYKFNKQGKSIWVAWSDNGQKSLSLNRLGISNARITEAVPDYENGKAIEDNNIPFEDMFKEYTLNDFVQLGDVPIFIENE